MQKPYRGDYKPDYEKWKTNKESFFVTYLSMSFFAFIIGIFFDFSFDWSPFGIKFHIFCLIATILYYIFVENPNYDRKVKESRIKAENEAERRYQEDMDRWYHYQNAEDEVDDRRLAREIKRKRALSQIDNEQLLDMYGRLSTIQYQTNQQAYLFYQEAQNALARGRTYELENSLDDLERALGV